MILATLRVARPVHLTLLLGLAILSGSTTAFGYTVRKDQSEYFYQSTPLTYTPVRAAGFDQVILIKSAKENQKRGWLDRRGES